MKNILSLLHKKIHQHYSERYSIFLKIKKGIFSLHQALLTPYEIYEDTTRKQYIVIHIAFGILMLVCLYGINVFYISITHFLEKTNTTTTINPFLMCGISIFFGICYVLARKKYWRFASYSIVIVYFLATVYGGYRWGASMPIGLLSYGLIIAIASATISFRFGLLVTVLSCCALILTGIHERSVPYIAHWKQFDIELHNIIEYVSMLGLTALISYISHRELQHSLKRAHASEALLKEERDTLEITVQQRIAAIQKIEHERIIELRRFAEFGKISAGVFHDLLNPLTSVSLSVTELADEQTLEKAVYAQKMIDMAIRSTKKMQLYIDNVRTNLHTRVFQEFFSAEEEISGVLDVVGFYAKRSSVLFFFEKEKTLSLLYGNRTQFHQVISNIVINAIEAFADTRTYNSRTITITTSHSAEELRITISDTAGGMSPEIASRIWDTFFTTKINGIGLGLSNTKAIIENDFQGTITCTTVLGEGTTFTITIPFSRTIPN